MIFAVSAHSTSLMADAAAMFVDAGTYLCNLIAEKWKDRPPTKQELELPQRTLEYRIQLRRLNLELFPPTISMILLLYITYSASLESIDTLKGIKSGDEAGDEGEANAGVMMFFGILFLVIDFVNMFYFSTANGAMIPFSYLHFESTLNGEIGSEYTSIEDEESSASYDGQDTENHQTNSSNSPRLNLNMCSAWTVRRSTHICSSCVQFLLLCAILTMIHSLSFYSMSLLTLLGAPRSLLQDQYPSFSKQSLLILPMLGLRLVYHSLFVSVPSP